MDPRIKKEAYRVAFFPESDQIRFLELFLHEVREDKDFIRAASSLADRILRPFLRFDSWMESRFEADMKLSPKDVAYQCRRYMKIDPRMTPLLRRLARKVKQRVLMRKRSHSKREADRIEGLPFELWEEHFTELKKEFENSRMHLLKRSRSELDSRIKLIDWMKQRLAEDPTLTTPRLAHEAYGSEEFKQVDASYLIYLVENIKDMLLTQKTDRLREKRRLLRAILNRAPHSSPSKEVTAPATQVAPCNAIGEGAETGEIRDGSEADAPGREEPAL